ncbi:PKD-like family lipoprotein [Gabonibacter massiliensis]|uniref:PKD-like family lipoprotein n=1 Tax=Gabonibacter massiliensis TaxID=1720195 RepID=UPI000B1D85F1|nr:PKD-like family lipoprotein [Gabonibacter massiliensis]
MKKRMKNMILWVIGLLLFSACYDDKGSYDYHDINEVAITLPTSQGVRLPKVDSVLVEITPDLKQTLVENESDLVFLWEKKLEKDMMNNWEICGHEKTCRIYIKPEDTEDIRLRLNLKDNTEGTTWYKEMVLKIIQPYSSTWFVLQDDGGKAVLGVVDGEGLSAVVIRDAYKEDTGKEWTVKGVPQCLTGNRIYGSPMNFLPPFMGFNPIVQRTVMALTDENMEVMDASTFETVWSLDEMLMQEGIIFSPRYLISRDGSSGGEMLINAGKVYYANMDGYSVYNSTKVEDGTSYRVEVGGNAKSRFFVYDEENHRFLNFAKEWSDNLERNINKYIRTSDRKFVDAPISLEFIGENKENEDTKNLFDPDKIDPAFKMVAMSEMSGGEKLLAFSTDVAERKIHVFEFSLAGWISGDKSHARCSGKFEIPFPEGSTGEELCFITSRGFDRIFFMASGNKIYKVDLNRSTPKMTIVYEHEHAGVTITNMKFKYYYNLYDWESESEIPYARVLAAVLDYGTDSGGIVEMQLNTAGDVDRNLNNTFEYKGFGKVVDICYTFK